MFLNTFIIIVNYKKIKKKFLSIIKHPSRPIVFGLSQFLRVAKSSSSLYSETDG